MANTREPILQPIPILSLRPTQMTVGMREVKEKRKRWREHKSKKKQAEASRQAHDPGRAGTGQALLRGRSPSSGARAARRGRQGHSGHRDRRSHHGRARRVLGRDGQQAMGLSLRRQGRAPAFQGYSEIGDGAQGRSRSAASPANCAASAALPRTPRRSANSCGRISCAGKCRARAWKTISHKAIEKALALGEKQGCGLSARLVRAGVGRLSGRRSCGFKPSAAAPS